MRYRTQVIAVGLIFSFAAAAPVEAQKLSSDQKRRVARADPREQDAVYNCLMEKNRGKKTGTIAGAGAGVLTGVIAGGNLGESALAGAAGGAIGRAVGSDTSKFCDQVLKRNP